VRQSGHTVVEIALAAAIFSLVLGIVVGFQSWVGRSAGRTVASTEAQRSVLQALDAIRRDVQGMCYREGQEDIRVAADGRSLMLRVVKPAADPWHNSYQPVSYYLASTKGSSGYRLMRHDEGGAAAIAGCTLGDLFVRLAESGRGLLLEVTCRGQVEGSTYTGSTFIPVPVLAAPAAYKPEGGNS
jgi:hypothetical protein